MITVHHLNNSRSQRVLWLLEELELRYEVRRYERDKQTMLAPRELRYLGLIGSRAKVARIYDQLVADAMSPDQLRNVHAPIGLDIGAVTPQEIAVSILAELIAVKHGKMRGRDATELSMQWNRLPVSSQSG